MSRSPDSTYRIQLHGGFRFEDAVAVVPYLRELGVTHLYCSPYLKSRAGSTHGYDVLDHSEVDPELGGSEGHDVLLATLAEHGMNHILDVVPNHMAVIGGINRWWWDVLKRGESSRYADWFDIDWNPPEGTLQRTILVPILGDHYGRVLERSELSLDLAEDEIVVRYFDHLLPLSDESVAAFGLDRASQPSLDRINGDRSALHDLLEMQHYRLAFWRAAGRELNYRRFFAIAELAALRIERREVFEAVHRFVLDLVRKGALDGLRIDHIDGLKFPTRYLRRLREEAGDTFVVVEKILEGDEPLPSAWPVEGTTGYEFAARLTGIFVDPAAEEPLTELYHKVIGENVPPHEMARECKHLLMTTELAADVDRLTEAFVSVSMKHLDYRDYTRHEVREAIKETIAAFPVYRTYVDAEESTSETTRAVIDRATRSAASSRPDLDARLLTFLGEVLALQHQGSEEQEFALRFQQLSGPVMAKGVEDTLLYRYNRFVALNEVGADPGRFGYSIGEFHEFNSRRQTEWPLSLLASSTHDTKRSEDVRARLCLLSEMPEAWTEFSERWIESVRSHTAAGWPDPNAQYLLLQTLVGAWPLSADRAVAYMEKASKEAKVYTSWIDPDEEYDQALAHFTRSVCSDDRVNELVDGFVQPLVAPGRAHSLSQTLLKLMSPGIPDIYQGTELWDLSLVDPDNRRAVDWHTRSRLLDEVAKGGLDAALEQFDAGAPKLFLIRTALSVRRELPDAFGPSASYEPLLAEGRDADRVIAFCRSGAAIAIAPRFQARDAVTDALIRLPRGRWRDVLSGASCDGAVSVSEAMARFPVALLVKERT